MVRGLSTVFQNPGDLDNAVHALDCLCVQFRCSLACLCPAETKRLQRVQRVLVSLKLSLKYSLVAFSNRHGVQKQGPIRLPV